MEKVLRDCLKPRNYKLVSDEHAFSASEINRGTNTNYHHHQQQQQQQPRPFTEYSYITPPRRTRDCRHDPPGDIRIAADGARTVPPRSTNLQSRGFGSNPRFAPPRNAYYLRPRDYVFVADGPTKTPRNAYLQPRDMGDRIDNSRSLHSSKKRNPPKNYGLVADNAKAIPPNSANDFQPRDYGPMTIHAKPTIPRRYTTYQPNTFDRAKPNVPKAISPHSANDFQPRDYGPMTIHAKTAIPRKSTIYKPNTFDHAKPNVSFRSGRDSFHEKRRDPFVTQPPSSSSSSPFSSFQEEREQALRDYKVTIEYKHLKSHAPGGVYLIPSMDSLRNFHGIIFVRRGPFTNGIFKFRLDLPAKYNDTNMWPMITFSSRVYNPYVNEETGQLDVQSAYPTWEPSRHYLVTVLTFLKKIFYSKNFAEAKANPAARELAEKDIGAYKKKVEACVHESQKKVYVNEKGSTSKFTEEEVAHRVLRDLLKHHIRNDNQVTKQTILAQVEKSRKV